MFPTTYGRPAEARGPRSLGYIPVLDGLRAVSIMIVVLSHMGFGKIMPGLLGVTIFFFVSGYLITGLLLEESASTGGIDIKSFYARRALRLFPAMFVAIAAGCALYTALGCVVTMPDLLAAVFYAANYRNYPEMAGPHSAAHPFVVLWSLGVEEHFYLVFPCVVLLLRRRPRTLIWTILASIFVVTVWRMHVVTSCAASPLSGFCVLPSRIEHGTDTRIDSVMVGCLLAVLIRSPAKAFVLRWMARWIAPALGVVLLLASLAIRDPWFRDTGRFSIQSVGLFLCIGSLLYGEPLSWLKRGLETGPMLHVGRWSYSLYLWHALVIVAAGGWLRKDLWMPLQTGHPFHLRQLTLVAIMLATSMALAWCSYTWVEQPFLALRKRFGSRTVPDDALEAADALES